MPSPTKLSIQLGLETTSRHDAYPEEAIGGATTWTIN